MGDDLLQVEAEKIFRQAVSAIKHCHLDIVHQDRKPQFFLKRRRGSCESNRLCHGHQVYNQHLTETTVCEKGGCFCGHMTAERQMCELGCDTLSPLGTTLSEEAP